MSSGWEEGVGICATDPWLQMRCQSRLQPKSSIADLSSNI